MERLAGIDANFLYAETATASMHTLKIGVFAARPGVTDVFERLKCEVERQLHLFPTLRRRVVFVPLNVHHPVWVEDPDLDVRRHVFRRPIAHPGGPREMDAAIAEIAARPLPRDRPLWEMWLLEGRADGQLVVVAKLHHALADGNASAAMLARLAESPEPEPFDTSEEIPSRRRLLAEALRDQPRKLSELGGLAAETVKAGLSILRSRGRHTERVPRPFTAPATALGGALPRERAFATSSLDLKAVKEVKARLGITVNDVFLGLTGEALVRYLRRCGEVPSRSLLASVPVAVNMPGGAGRLSGNHLSNIITAIPTGAPGPLERMLATRRLTRAAMKAHDLLGHQAMVSWAEHTPPNLFRGFMQAYSRLRLADHHRPPVNVILSNVKGPPNPLNLAGLRLKELYSVGPILHGIGLNLTAWSYAGRMNVAALARGGLPLDLHEITGALPEILEELRASSPARRPSQPRSRPREPHRAV